MKKGYIYGIYCLFDNIIRYVGQTTQKNLDKRLRAHIYETNRNKKLNKNLTHKENWIVSLQNKNLINNLSIKLLEECDISIIDDREIYWINFYKNKLLTNTANGGKRFWITDEIKKKISIANSGEKNGMYGKTYKKTKEQIEKARKAMISSKKFQESRKSKEYREKISKIQKVDDWILLDKSFNIIKTFNSSREVAEYLHCTKGNVKNARRDNRILCKKYIIMYKTDYNKLKNNV